MDKGNFRENRYTLPLSICSGIRWRRGRYSRFPNCWSTSPLLRRAWGWGGREGREMQGWFSSCVLLDGMFESERFASSGLEKESKNLLNSDLRRIEEGSFNIFFRSIDWIGVETRWLGLELCREGEPCAVPFWSGNLIFAADQSLDQEHDWPFCLGKWSFRTSCPNRAKTMSTIMAPRAEVVSRGRGPITSPQFTLVKAAGRLILAHCKFFFWQLPRFSTNIITHK